MKHRLLFALPFSSQNLNRMRRLGVAVFEELNLNGQPALTAARRLAIVDGSVTLADVLAYDKTGWGGSTQSLNFQTVYQLNNSGTQDFYGGFIDMGDTWWNRIADRITNAPVTGMRYARLERANGHYILTPDYNVAALAQYEGQVMTPKRIAQILGIRPYGEL
jgi:hypothetical protein